MCMEIQTGSGGILSYLQDILGGGGDSVLVNKKEWGGFCPGGILSYTREQNYSTILKHSLIRCCYNNIHKQKIFLTVYEKKKTYPTAQTLDLRVSHI